MTRTTCRCCGSQSLKTYLDLGGQPLANSYHKGAESLPAYPLRVNVCTYCWHSQLSHVVPPDEMFRNYLYVSGTTKTLKDHFEELAYRTTAGHSLDTGGGRSYRDFRVLDIACNDGTLLEQFRKVGCRVFGVDPAENLRDLTRRKEIPVIVDYWSMRLAETMEPFDIITAVNVAAHVDDFADFLEGCKRALKPDGVVVVEVPYAADMIRKREFDTIYHEHLSYFLVGPFEYIVEIHGFYIADMTWSKIHGGSLRFTLKLGGLGPCNRAMFMRQEEARVGLTSHMAYADFSRDVDRTRSDFNDLLSYERAHGHAIVGYGASAKGNTALNFFGIKLDYIVDDNPMKHGYLTPGMDIPIRPPSALAEDRRDLAIVVLSWNFAKEIAGKIAALRPGRPNDRVIVYVPRVRSVPLADAAIAFAEVSA